jgi:transposase
MDAYSADLRVRILDDCDGGMTTRVVATKYRVSESWVRRLKQRRRETGETSPRSSRPKTTKKVLADHLELLQQLIRETPDATLEELRSKLPVQVSVTTIWRTLEELKISFKKKSSTRPSRTDRTFKCSVRPGKPK